jgi:hypothetical protein
VALSGVGSLSIYLSGVGSLRFALTLSLSLSLSLDPPPLAFVRQLSSWTAAQMDCSSPEFQA